MIYTTTINRAQVPIIGCLNMTRGFLPYHFDDLINAIQAFLDQHFTTIWGCPARLEAIKPKHGIPTGAWGLVVSKAKSEMGSLTADSLPIISVRLDDPTTAATSISFALAAALVNPTNNGAVLHQGLWYGRNVTSAVRGTTFSVKGFLMANFVYPAWFDENRVPKSTQFDHNKVCSKPFQILPGGYMPVWDIETGWHTIYGSKKSGKVMVMS